jgi:hypothetical protein
VLRVGFSGRWRVRAAPSNMIRSNLMGILSILMRDQRGRWCAPALAALVALGCALEESPPSPGSGGAGSTAGAGGGAGGPMTGGSAGTAMTGGSGGAAAGAGGQAGAAAGSTSGGTAGLDAGGAGTSGGSGAAGMSGSAGDGASGAGNGGMSGSAGASGAAGAGAGGAAGSAGAGGAAAGSAGSSGAAGASAGAAGSGGAPSFQPCPATGPCIVQPFGDSITDGFNVPGGFRMELFSRARDDMHDITYVGSLQNGPTMVDNVAFPRRHEGHSGWRIDQLLGLTPNPAFATVPHIVLLMIGTNDAINNDNLAQAPTRLGNLIDQIVMAAPNALLVVAKLTPLSGTNNTRVQAYNDAIPAVVNQRVSAGKHLLLIDQFTGFPMNELADGIHPNEAGYTRMAGVWYAAIEGYLR